MTHFTCSECGGLVSWKCKGFLGFGDLYWKCLKCGATKEFERPIMKMDLPEKKTTR